MNDDEKIAKRRETDRKSHKRSREYYISHGICPVCKANKPEDGYKICSSCRKRQAENNKRSREKHICEYNARYAEKRRLLYAQRVHDGICIRCGKEKVVPGRRKCEKCGATYIGNKVRFKANNYPGLCYVCGERAIEGMRLCAEHYRKMTGREFPGESNC